MKRRDPIIEDLHKLRERIGRAHGFDVDRIAATIRQHECEAGRALVEATSAHAKRRAKSPRRRAAQQADIADVRSGEPASPELGRRAQPRSRG